MNSISSISYLPVHPIQYFGYYIKLVISKLFFLYLNRTSNTNVRSYHLDFQQVYLATGLDGSPSQKDTFDLQKQVFEKILLLVSNENSKILTIHSRNAAQETITLLAKYLSKSNCKVILHWYSGSISDMKIAVDNDFYFSINHKMASSAKGQEIIRNIPDRLLLTETDAPFTFSSVIRTRLQSLNSTIKTVAYQKNTGVEDIKLLFYRNFETLLRF